MVKQIGYCVKCCKKREMKKITKKILGNRMQVKGVCAVCKTNMSTFAKK